MSLFGLAAVGSTLAASGGTLLKLFSLASRTGRAASAASQAAKPNSIAKFTSISRVEPLCMVDTDCVHLEYLTDVLNSLQSVFTGYYLQAVGLMGTVSGCRVAEFLDPLNPSRNPNVGQFLKATADVLGVPNPISMDSYKWKLPNAVSTEADAPRPPAPSQAIDDKSITNLQDRANLSVGKLVNVTVSINGQKTTIPISIRLLVNELSGSTIISVLGNTNIDKSFTERYYKWKSGRISFINDLILCRDLIKERRKAVMEDKEGTLTEIYERASRNITTGILTKRPSVASSSNMYVISEETARRLKAQMRIDINNFAQRQAMFDNTYTMILVVIDREYQRINFYHDGVRAPTSLGLRDIKNANKGDGPSIMDIYSALRQGQSPSF